MLVNLGLDHKLPFQNRWKTVYWFVEFAPQLLLEIIESDNRFVLANEVLELQMPQKYKKRFTSITEQRNKSEQELKEIVALTSFDNVSGGNYNSYEFSLKIGGIRYGM